MTILRAVTPAFGRLAAVAARLEGQIQGRYGTDREAEEIGYVIRLQLTHTVI
jgi:hypothetical protein